MIIGEDKYKSKRSSFRLGGSPSSPAQQKSLLSPSSASLLHGLSLQYPTPLFLVRNKPLHSFQKTQLPTANMKFSATAVAILASTVAAAPLAERATGSTISELDNGGCRPYILFHARGTGQAGNVVCPSSLFC